MIGWSAIAAAGGLLLIDRVAVLTMRPPRRVHAGSPPSLAHPREKVEFRSDGLTLRGTLVEPAAARPTAPLAILVHGWTGSAEAMLLLGAPLVDAGIPVLAFDVRSHGRSDRAPHVTVRQFRDDLTRAVEFAAEIRPGRRRVVVGHSLGGAAAILAAARGAVVHGVALVAAPADLFEVTAGFYSDHGLPGRLLTRVLLPFWRLRAGESFRRLDPEARAGELSVPATIVQGGQDRRVPAEHAQRLARATGAPVTLVPECGHRDVLAHPATHAELLRFLREFGVDGG